MDFNINLNSDQGTTNDSLNINTSTSSENKTSEAENQTSETTSIENQTTDVPVDVALVVSKKKVVRKSIFPSSQSDIIQVARRNIEKWKINDKIYLPYTTLVEYELKVNSYQSVAFALNSSTTNIKLNSERLSELGYVFDDKMAFIKMQLKINKKTHNISSYYGDIGCSKKSGAYQLPRSKNEKADALAILSKGLETHGIIDDHFGKTALDPLINEYIELVGGKFTTKATGTMSIGSKNDLKTEIEQVQRSLVNLLKAYYPTSWEREIRDWGFQRESY